MNIIIIIPTNSIPQFYAYPPFILHQENYTLNYHFVSVFYAEVMRMYVLHVVKMMKTCSSETIKRCQSLLETMLDNRLVIIGSSAYLGKADLPRCTWENTSS